MISIQNCDASFSEVRGSLSMTDQSDDEFDHENLVENKVIIMKDNTSPCIGNMTPPFPIKTGQLNGEKRSTVQFVKPFDAGVLDWKSFPSLRNMSL